MIMNTSPIQEVGAVVSPATLLQRLDALSAECNEWEESLYKTANDTLYEILARVYAVYLDAFINGHPMHQQVLRDHLEVAMKSRQMRIFKDTTVLGMLIRYVFNCDRKRLYRYSKAIQAANAHGKRPDELATWLRDCGGIDEVAKPASKKDQSEDTNEEKQRREVNAIEKLIRENTEQPLAEVSLSGYSSSASTVLLLAIQGPQETFRILAVIDSFEESMMNSLLRYQAASNVKLQAKMAYSKRERDAFRSAASAKVEQLPAQA